MTYTRTKKLFVTFVVVFVVAMTSASFQLWAQDTQNSISLRTGLHDTYTRLVFDASQLPAYTIEKREDGSLALVFNDSVSLTKSDNNVSQSDVINNVAVSDSSAPGTLSVNVGLSGDYRFRHFAIGNRLVVDVFVPRGGVVKNTQNASDLEDSASKVSGSSEATNTSAEKEALTQSDGQVLAEAEEARQGTDLKTATSLADVEKLLKSKIEKDNLNVKVGSTIANTAPVSADETPVAEEAVTVKEPSKPSEPSEFGDLLADATVTKVGAQGNMPTDVLSGEESAPDEKVLPEGATDRTHVISLSVTERIGVAGFERAGWFWLVINDPEFSIRPTISGPREDEFSRFEKISAENGTAFRVKLPAGLGEKRVGQGGGLIWRAYLGPSGYDVKPVKLKRVYSLQTPSLVVAEKDQKAYLLWPAATPKTIVKIKDPDVGDYITVVTVENVDDFIGEYRDYVDVEFFRSTIGAAFRVKSDDVSVMIAKSGVKFKRADGFKMSRRDDVNIREIRENVEDFEIDVVEETVETPVKDDTPRAIVKIFEFDKWNVGGMQSLQSKQQQIFLRMSDKNQMGVVEDLLTLAKMNLANNRAQEAIGFLNLAINMLPEIGDSVEYKALHGLSMALARRYEEAFILFNDEALKGYGELDYWRAYTLAWLEDWEQAQNVSPSDLDVLIAYPIVLLERVGIKLAEVALRNGKLDEAEELLKVLEDKRRETSESTKNGIRYLRGVVKQLEGNLDEAEEYWTDLLESNDDFYRARAGLAMILTRQGIQTISVEKAIDLLEGLRFTWRGDEIEARTLFSLGKFYVEDDQYIKGLSILRDAAGLRPDSDVSQEIARNMRLIFEDLILVDEDITALEATSVFEEFKELTPVDQAGRRLVQRLAERMVEADLLGRAAELLRFQVDFRLEGEEKANIATRLATIYILDEKNDEALGMLKLADNLYKSLFQRESYTSKNVELSMLKAQALFQSGLSEEALDVLIALDPKPTINKLRADIAWQSALWADAAEALDYIMQDKDLYSATSLSEANSDLILNRAVALNLASDRVELSSLRNRFLVEMNKTSNARLFDVVTRPRQTSIIAGEDTLETLVEEVSIFSDFMESYKKNK